MMQRKGMQFLYQYVASIFISICAQFERLIKEEILHPLDISDSDHCIDCIKERKILYPLDFSSDTNFLFLERTGAAPTDYILN
jgi:hypothetical protein